MDSSFKFRLKVFLWDQFILPFYLIFTMEQLRSIFIAILIVNFVTLKSFIIFISSTCFILFTSILDVFKYWKSGEFMHNYRKYKYGDYRKVAKEFKKQEIQNG